MEVLLSSEYKKETATMFNFFNEMTPTARQNMLIFMQGVKFAESIQQKKNQSIKNEQIQAEPSKSSESVQVD